ncbi:hypothetical protein TWF481_007111 [Arthrobotrys musiformis]|uniref:Uncharacterized protein n=1 Tax=Arthrobotrys musiformis TaxID=47236 RepID=A0AAV9WAG0_9PEZI
MQSAECLHKPLPPKRIILNQLLPIPISLLTFPMPKWKEICVRFKAPLNGSKIEACLPPPSSFQNTLIVLASPFRSVYFWVWLVYSFSSNGFARLDNVRIPPPFSQIYSFLLGSTELAASVKFQILSIIYGNTALSWFFFLFGPELLPGGFRDLFESLQYYDDWIEAYKLGLLLVPELWGLIKKAPYFCLQLVNLFPKAIFIVLVILPFASFNFIVVGSLSPLLADLFHREFESNFKVWESHIIEPLICWYIPISIATTMAMPVSGKIIDAGLYTYRERKPSAGIPWAFFIWFFISIFSSSMLMLAVLFAWDLSFFALPWCFFSISYYFRGARKRRAALYGNPTNTGPGSGQSSVDRDHMWATGWMNGYREGQIQYRKSLYELMGDKDGDEADGENDGDDDDQGDYDENYQAHENHDEKGKHLGDDSGDPQGRYSGYFGQFTGSRKPKIPNSRKPQQGLGLTDAALKQGDRAAWEGDRTTE